MYVHCKVKATRCSLSVSGMSAGGGGAIMRSYMLRRLGCWSIDAMRLPCVEALGLRCSVVEVLAKDARPVLWGMGKGGGSKAWMEFGDGRCVTTSTQGAA